MIKYFICLIVILACSNLHAQNIQDFKTKNSSNQKERTAMLDLLRAKMKKSLKIECSYVVEHFKVSSNYAWMKGTAQRKDGKPLELNPDLDLIADSELGSRSKSVKKPSASNCSLKGDTR